MSDFSPAPTSSVPPPPPGPPPLSTRADLRSIPPAGQQASGATTISVPLGVPMYRFDGGAATYLGVGILAVIITVFTLGICYPWAKVILYRWQAKHTFLWGRRLRFTGTAPALFGQWVKWYLLWIVTLGIYGFWIGPRMTRWLVEHQEFDPAG